MTRLIELKLTEAEAEALLGALVNQHAYLGVTISEDDPEGIVEKDMTPELAAERDALSRIVDALDAAFPDAPWLPYSKIA